MKTSKFQWIMRQAFFLVCVSLLACGLVVAQQPVPTEQAPKQLLSAEQLNTLVAPVALYPDALLSQVLVASTYPLEIVVVGQWLQRNSNLQGPKLVDAVRQQNWDPSIQALVVFPEVIKHLNADIRWTTDLGNAFLAQQADVNECRAADAGPSRGCWQTAIQRAGNRHDREESGPIGNCDSTDQPRGCLRALLQSCVYLGTAPLRLLSRLGLSVFRLWIRPWHLYWRLFRRPLLGWLGVGAKLVSLLNRSEPLLFRSLRLRRTRISIWRHLDARSRPSAEGPLSE